MRTFRDSRLTIILLSIFFLLVVAYGLFEAWGLVSGPVITISNDLTSTSTPFIVVQGKAERITSLTMNGAPISVTETGDFLQPYLLAPGYNRIVLDATDSYGRAREKVIEIVYTPIATSSPGANTASISATSTSASSSLPSASSTTTMAPER